MCTLLKDMFDVHTPCLLPLYFLFSVSLMPYCPLSFSETNEMATVSHVSRNTTFPLSKYNIQYDLSKYIFVSTNVLLVLGKSF